MRLPSRLKRVKSLVSICLLLLMTTGILSAQSAQIDQTFNPAVTKEDYIAPFSSSGNILFQPDGKIVFSALYRQTQFSGHTYFSRVNADGSLDTTFNCQVCSEVGFTELFLSPDGKILLITTITVFTGGQRARLIWLNQDGSIDRSLTTTLLAGTVGSHIHYTNRIIAVQPDGKVFVEQTQTAFSSTSKLHRVNADGTQDDSFQALSFSTGNGVKDFALLPDGRFFVAGGNYNPARFNANGTLDASFENPSVTPGAVLNFGIQSNGKVVIGGEFTNVNGIARTGLARLHPAGNVDLDFAPSAQAFPVTRVEISPNDKIIYSSYNGIWRLNADGTPDNTFNAPAFSYLNWKLDSLGRVVFFARVEPNVYRFGRLNADGTLETFFSLPARKGTISALARQADGKIVAAGEFDKINGAVRNRIGRLNADGSVDAPFETGSGFDIAPEAVAVQADGKILAGGRFTSYNGTARANIARLNADGTLDNSFNPSIGGIVLTIAVQADGKILVGGTDDAPGDSHAILLRLNADGSRDTAFNPLVNGIIIRSIIAEADGKIMVGGIFSGISGFARTNLARLNADGSVDTTFSAAGVDEVTKIVRQPDGKYLYASRSVFRRNNDGSLDNTFQSPTFGNSGFPTINDIALHADGTIIIGGIFGEINGILRRNIARLFPNGAVDRLYMFDGANGQVKALISQPDGKTLVGGNFTIIEGASRAGLARINNVPLLNRFPYFDFNGDGKTDIAVFRPANGFWYIARSTGTPSQNFDAVQFGANGDVIVPADYDGDGRADVAVWRPSDGVWYLMQSTAGFRAAQFGTNGDIPVPGDYDADGKANLAVFRPSTGSWYIARPTGVPAQNFDSVPFGISTDKPIAGRDFDGDGKADVTVFRPSDGVWYRLNSSTGQFVAILFGTAEDKPVAEDYDGDGRTDIAIWRPSTGIWYRLNSSNNSYHEVRFGVAQDRPAPGDYNGDGKADFVVFRPSEGNWYLLHSNNAFTGAQFGTNGDLPAANAFVR